MGVSGYYRIRSKTQGVAISLGDVIKMKQKNLWCVCSQTEAFVGYSLKIS